MYHAYAANGDEIGVVTDRSKEELDEDELTFWALRIGAPSDDRFRNAEFATLEEAKKWVEEIESEHA